MQSLVGRICQKPVCFVDPFSTVADASRAMTDRNIGAVLIGNEMNLRGIFTERDLVNRVISEGRDAETTPVSQVMTPHVTTIHESRVLEDALSIMSHANCRHLPVVNTADHVVGILSLRDILSVQVRSLEIEKDELVSYISDDIAVEASTIRQKIS